MGGDKASFEGWTDPADLSSLYFSSTAKENEDTTTTAPYYIGPVEIRTKDNVSTERGLFASSDIALGDPLMILPATANACVNAVYEEWNKTSVDVNVAAERVLVQAILQAQETNTNLLRSLACLEGSGSDYSTHDVDDLLPILLGEDNPTKAPTVECLSEHQIQQVIRRNAFGPEFSTAFTRVQQRWEAGESDYRPPRFRGPYPLAFMINH